MFRIYFALVKLKVIRKVRYSIQALNMDETLRMPAKQLDEAHRFFQWPHFCTLLRHTDPGNKQNLYENKLVKLVWY